MEMHQNASNLKGTALKQSIFLEAYFNNKGHISKACETAEINRSTYQRWNKQKNFSQKLLEKIEAHNDKIWEIIFEKAESGNERLLMFWARTQMKHRGFVEKQELDITGQLDNKIEVIWGNENNSESEVNEDSKEK